MGSRMRHIELSEGLCFAKFWAELPKLLIYNVLGCLAHGHIHTFHRTLFPGSLFRYPSRSSWKYELTAAEETQVIVLLKMSVVAKLFDLQFIHRRFLIPLARYSSLSNFVPSRTSLCYSSMLLYMAQLLLCSTSFLSSYLPSFLLKFLLSPHLVMCPVLLSQPLLSLKATSFL